MKTAVITTVGSQLSLQIGQISRGVLRAGIVLPPGTFMEMLLGREFQSAVVSVHASGNRPAKGDEVFNCAALSGSGVSVVTLKRIEGLPELAEARDVTAYRVNKPIAVGTALASEYGARCPGLATSIDHVERILDNCVRANAPRVILRGLRDGVPSSLVVVMPIPVVQRDTTISDMVFVH